MPHDLSPVAELCGVAKRRGGRPPPQAASKGRRSPSPFRGGLLNVDTTYAPAERTGPQWMRDRTTSCYWRAMLDEDEHYVYAIAL